LARHHEASATGEWMMTTQEFPRMKETERQWRRHDGDEGKPAMTTHTVFAALAFVGLLFIMMISGVISMGEY
jgi:hypothetical protein